MESKILVENRSERAVIDHLSKNTNYESKIKIISSVPHDVEVDEDNPIEIEVIVAPKSTCALLVEKYDEDAIIVLGSKLAVTYPPEVLLSEEKFPEKAHRLKYKNKPVDVFESVIEHNTGVFFKYKNKTNDLNVTIHITFPQLENLAIGIKSTDIEGFFPSVTEYTIKNNAQEVFLHCEPGQMQFFELYAIDFFEAFDFSIQTEYIFNIIKK